MLIKINDTHRIKSLDAVNIAIQTLGEDKDGKPRWDNVAYFLHLNSALVRCVDGARFVHGCKNLKEYKVHLDRINEIKEEFKEILTI